MKIRYFFIFFLVNISVFGQIEPDKIIEKDIIDFGFVLDAPLGNHRSKLKSPFVSTNSLGIYLSYLINPGAKSDLLSSVFLGGEIGIFGTKQVEFNKPAPDGDFFMNHRTAWLHFKGRYLPYIYSEKYLPLIDFSMGPVLYSSTMAENLGNDEVDKFYKYKDFAINAKVEAGLQIKLRNERKPFSFMGISVGFSASNPVKMINRNKIGFDSAYNVLEALNTHNPRGLFMKLNWSSYR
jgi:hypothetical protein